MIQQNTMLHEHFKFSQAWSAIIEYESAEISTNQVIDLCFFPIDNTLGRADPSLKKLLTLVEDEIEKADYVQAEQPLSWLQAWIK